MKNFFATALIIASLLFPAAASAQQSGRQIAYRTIWGRYDEYGCEELERLLSDMDGVFLQYVQEVYRQTPCGDDDGDASDERIAAIEADIAQLRQGQLATGRFVAESFNEVHNGLVDIAEAIDGGGGGHTAAPAIPSIEVRIDNRPCGSRGGVEWTLGTGYGYMVVVGPRGVVASNRVVPVKVGERIVNLPVHVGTTCVAADSAGDSFAILIDDGDGDGVYGPRDYSTRTLTMGVTARSTLTHGQRWTYWVRDQVLRILNSALY